MEQKYTLKEFEKLFNKAKMEVLKEMEKNFEKAAQEDGKADSMAMMAFNLQNMLCLTELKMKLFPKEEI